ncbi:MAG: hypothetical protein A2V84_10500 [Chloroflexi bacterium RBG_16_70_13]|nr:MAG: hypothetical protein A2V84_10500 [Chloroflexi bacterium RBG_16_70_13]
MAAIVNRPSALSVAVAIAPSDIRTGAMSMIRVRSVVLARPASSKPGASARTSSGAPTKAATASTDIATRRRLASVPTTRQAWARSPLARRPARTGMSAEPMAPAATSWKMRSGTRKAAKNASSSAPVPNVAPRTTVRR